MMSPLVVRMSLPAVGLLCAAAACAPGSRRSADAAAIRRSDSLMVSAINAHDLDAWLGFLTEDIRLLPPGEPAVDGKAAVGPMLAGYLALPGFVMRHRARVIGVSQSGDLAYLTYRYEATAADSAQGTVTQRGKDLSIYRRQPDGSWKVAVDMWSPDEPTPSGGTPQPR
jgi:ketosteroid isomerase-like protein